MKKITVIAAVFVAALSLNTNAQNKLDIEHLMDGTYRLKINVHQPKFEDNGSYSYYDNKWQKHVVDKNGNDKTVEQPQQETIEGALFTEQSGNNKAYIKAPTAPCGRT